MLATITFPLIGVILMNHGVFKLKTYNKLFTGFSLDYGGLGFCGLFVLLLRVPI
jgi:hypothetical protein